MTDAARRRARREALANTPPDEPSVLLHGDLLGQNILLHPSEPPAIIDWEAATLGDPAYDLAIITRGVRRPFQIDRGLERLLDAYNACALRAHRRLRGAPPRAVPRRGAGPHSPNAIRTAPAERVPARLHASRRVR